MDGVLEGVLESGAFEVRRELETGEEYVSADDCTVIILDDYNTFYNQAQIGWEELRTKKSRGEDATPKGAYRLLFRILREFHGAVYLSSGSPTG